MPRLRPIGIEGDVYPVGAAAAPISAGRTSGWVLDVIEPPLALLQVATDAVLAACADTPRQVAVRSGTADGYRFFLPRGGSESRYQ